jgi:hypothetical protein
MCTRREGLSEETCCQDDFGIYGDNQARTVPDSSIAIMRQRVGAWRISLRHSGMLGNVFAPLLSNVPIETRKDASVAKMVI